MSGFVVRIHQHCDHLTRDGVDGQGHVAGFEKMVGDGGKRSEWKETVLLWACRPSASRG